jgi:hypothetical protein
MRGPVEQLGCARRPVKAEVAGSNPVGTARTGSMHLLSPGQVAQSVERAAENRKVGGSIPSLPTTSAPVRPSVTSAPFGVVAPGSAILLPWTVDATGGRPPPPGTHRPPGCRTLLLDGAASRPTGTTTARASHMAGQAPGASPEEPVGAQFGSIDRSGYASAYDDCSGIVCAIRRCEPASNSVSLPTGGGAGAIRSAQAPGQGTRGRAQGGRRTTGLACRWGWAHLLQTPLPLR